MPVEAAAAAVVEVAAKEVTTAQVAASLQQNFCYIPASCQCTPVARIFGRSAALNC